MKWAIQTEYGVIMCKSFAESQKMCRRLWADGTKRLDIYSMSTGEIFSYHFTGMKFKIEMGKNEGRDKIQN